MFKCTKCGYTGETGGTHCHSCSEKTVYTKEDAEVELEEARRLIKGREHEAAIELYSRLADMGVTEAEREFGEILERGAIAPRNLDGAMSLFLRAAKKNDAYSAYRYSRLASRISDEVARFWLFYSAVLGCERAYPELARHLSEEGREELATYYYYLAAASEDRESIVEMAMRYYKGVGATRSEGYAKWYMDRLFIPPIYTIKMAYKLRGVSASEPPVPMPENYDAILRTLAKDAKKYKADAAYFFLNELLADRGDVLAEVAVGASLVEGFGCKRDIEQGMRRLENAAAHGCADAYGYLGSLYIGGEHVERDVERGVSYLESAGECGSVFAYELLGDIYRYGDGVERNYAVAIDRYEKAALHGSALGREKAAELSKKREDFFDRGRGLEEVSAEEAFRAYAISAAMGFIPAEHRLASCYENGVGTEPDRAMAYYWYNSAVKHGDTEALFDLARCYAYGIGVAFDYKRAIKLFLRSGGDGVQVKREIARLLERKKRRIERGVFSRAMRLLYQKKFEPAVELLLLCEELGHGQGIYTLGCLLEFGLGVGMNRERAYALYERAYKLLFRDPRQIYKLIVLKMVR